MVVHVLSTCMKREVQSQRETMEAGLAKVLHDLARCHDLELANAEALQLIEEQLLPLACLRWRSPLR